MVTSDDLTGNEIFKRSPSEYNINLNPVEEYIRQATKYLSGKHGITSEHANTLVKEILTTQKREGKITNPVVKYNCRNDRGDMEVKEDHLTNYLEGVVQAGEVLVPSGTSYIHPSKKKSIHADFLAINIAKRSSDKKKAFSYKQLGDTSKSLYYNTLQKVRKIFNNSLSGAYASKSTILYNPSAHYTLTSITRSVASIGNAVTESVIAGNKQFRNSDITLNYVVAIVTNIKKNTVTNTIHKYSLYIPTPQEVLDMIKYSSRWYWSDVNWDKDMLQYLSTLEGYELAAIMYVNDLWHMKKYNNDFVKKLLYNMSRRCEHGSTNYLSDLNNAAEGINNLTHHICMNDIKGKNINYKELQELIDLEGKFLISKEYRDGTVKTFKEYLIHIKHKIIYSGGKVDDKNFNKLHNKDTNPEKLLCVLASTTKHVMKILYKYRLLFRCFFTTDIMPPGVSYIKDMMRDSIVLSDTDSTCGSYDKWVEWYFGHIKFTAEAIALSAAAMTINTQVIDHHLKIFARNMNVDADRVELLKMKNEFFWTVFTATNVSKHYFANTLSQEGNIFDKPELELKGVHLIASAMDQSIVDRVHKMLTDINEHVSNGNKIKLHSYVTQIADMERSILKSIKSGDISIYRKDKIKDKKSYKDIPTKSPYLNHILWHEVFEGKYGSPGEPTYMVIKIPTIIKSKKRLREFVDSIEDEDVKSKLSDFIKKYKREAMGTFRPPLSIVSGSGIPEEIIKFIDSKRIVTDSLNIAYTAFEALGFYRKPGRIYSEMGY